MTEQPQPKTAKASRRILPPEEVERLRRLVGFNPDRDIDKHKKRRGGWAARNKKVEE